jgi:hypothetical protein
MYQAFDTSFKKKNDLQFMAKTISMCNITLYIGRWFSPDTPVSSTNKTDRHDIAEILLKVALNIINQTF